MNKFFDIIIPRFITEEVALLYTDDNEEEVEVLCSLKDIREGEYYDCVGTMRSFNFFGIGIFGRLTYQIKSNK